MSPSERQRLEQCHTNVVSLSGGGSDPICAPSRVMTSFDAKNSTPVCTCGVCYYGYAAAAVNGGAGADADGWLIAPAASRISCPVVSARYLHIISHIGGRSQWLTAAGVQLAWHDKHASSSTCRKEDRRRRRKGQRRGCRHLGLLSCLRRHRSRIFGEFFVIWLSTQPLRDSSLTLNYCDLRLSDGTESKFGFCRCWPGWLGHMVVIDRLVPVQVQRPTGR